MEAVRTVEHLADLGVPDVVMGVRLEARRLEQPVDLVRLHAAARDEVDVAQRASGRRVGGLGARRVRVDRDRAGEPDGEARLAGAIDDAKRLQMDVAVLDDYSGGSALNAKELSMPRERFHACMA